MMGRVGKCDDVMLTCNGLLVKVYREFCKL
jgi:hypothetical protein